MQSKLHDVKWGLALAIFAVLLSFCFGAGMGGFEDNIRDYWKASAQATLVDPQKVSSILDRSWTALIRAHLHAGAIGAACIALIYVLSNLETPKGYRQISSLFLGLGSIGYPMSWFFTAFRAPVIGNISAAKASVHWLAALSIGMLLLGVIAVLIPVVAGRFRLSKSSK